MHIYLAKSSRFESTDFASVMIDAADVISVPSVFTGLLKLYESLVNNQLLEFSSRLLSIHFIKVIAVKHYSSSPMLREQRVLQLMACLMSETEVTLPGVTIHGELRFSQQTSQLNALVRISKHLDINSCKVIYNDSPWVLLITAHFCGQINNQKLENEKAGTTTVLIQRSGSIALTVLNSFSTSVAYKRQWIGSELVQIMACRLFGAKPLSKPMLGYCQLDP